MKHATSEIEMTRIYHSITRNSHLRDVKGYAANERKGWLKLAFLVVLALLVTFGIVSPALAAPGDLDTFFGDEGMVRKPIDEGGMQNIAVQSDGKIVTAGGVYDNLVLRRHNADGSPDTTFDGDGKVVTTVLQRPGVSTVEIQPDGKILVAGSKGWDYAVDDECEPQCFFLARYNADGSPDTTFGGDGQVATKVGAWYDQVSAVTFQPDGKIIAGGWSQNGTSNSGLALARYNADGSLDTTFSTDGKARGEISGGSEIALDQDGKILATGVYFDEWSSAGDEFALTRYYGGNDATAPGPVTGFTAPFQNGDVQLSWINPTESDYESTRILRSTTGYATSATQTTGQTKVYEETGTSYLDVGLAEVTYYYTAFARDDNGNWSVAGKAPIPPQTTIDAAPCAVTTSPCSSTSAPPSRTLPSSAGSMVTPSRLAPRPRNIRA